ncbi:MAG: heat-inducible transcriptional repressor HrcA [Acidimicrobiales bacterium]
MLDERKAAILGAIVEEYIDTGQPVGSQHLAANHSFAVSSATLRNEMMALEHEGYLVQPHTSAGRVPTDKGYRFFVDTVAPPGDYLRLGEVQRDVVRDFFKRAHGELEQVLRDTSRLLSALTDHAAVVVAPPVEVAVVRSLQLVGIAPRLAVLVVVLSSGAVEKRTIELPVEASDALVAGASSHLAAHVVGKSLSEAPGPAPSGDAAKDLVVAAAMGALGTVGPAGYEGQVFVGGTSRVAGGFDAVGTVREVLSILEQHLVVMALLKDVIDRGLSVAIGQEHGLASLSDCAVVVAPYEVDSRQSGSIGVLGPTRMNYPQAMAAVAIVSQRLGSHLSEG